MHRGMIVLVISGILAGYLSAADDPFDFSSPLDTRTTRTAQYFSRSNETAAAETAGSSVGPGSRPSTAQLLEGSTDGEDARREPSVRFGNAATQTRTAAPRAAAASQHSPQQTLRRFDEFLKARDVVSAEYTESSSQPKPQVRQVQLEVEDDLPAFGDLDGEPAPVQPPVQPPRTSDAWLLSNPAASSGGRLTDPISTAPRGEPALNSDPEFNSKPQSDPEFNPGLFTGHAIRPEPQDVAPANRAPNIHEFEASSAVEATPAPFVRTQSASRTVSAADEDGSPAAVQSTWKLLDPLNVGQQCRAELVVTNTGSAPAERISLEVRVPETVRVVTASPEPVEQVAFLGWKIPQLAGGESQAIQVVFVTSQAGPLDLATYVRHTSARVDAYTVTEPKLELALSGPEQVQVGEPASQTLVVKNPGTGTATNVTIDALIPSGLEHATGEHLQMDIGSLNPGEVRSVRLVMAAVSGGSHIVQVEARADAGIVRTAAAEVNVIAPSLRTAIAGPSLRYLGREAEYTIRVLNDGSASTDFVQVNHRIPEGFEFVRANRGATFDANTRVLNWYVGRLESGESLDLSLALLPKVAGEYTHLVRATSETGAQADAQVNTRVQGAASLVLKVTDLDDPVEVETETAYEVTITNEGTASAHDVGLTCELPQGVAFLKAEGPSENRLQDGFVGFRPVTELAPGESLTFRVFVKGSVAGDKRFRCRLSSEALQQPLFAEELTKFYSE
jgi:uncharacterized repeat protein (TIGR01451 family)